MKKILILSNSSSGLYEFRNEIILDFMRDHEVHVSVPDMDKYYDKLQDEGCIMHHTEFERRGMNPLKDIQLYKKYRALVRQIKPDIVCTYTIKPNIYGGFACKMTRTPYIVNITGLGTAIQGGGILAKILVGMYKISTSKAKCIFFQNEYNMHFMNDRGIGSNVSKLLPGSGVNLEVHKYRPYPSEENGINILSVMRIMKDKGIEEYFEVVDKLASDKIHFILAGNYEEETREKYEPVLNRLVREGKLEYLGFVDDMDALYERCHIVLHPSYHEGLSNVCLEAAACGRPVLASDIPGCRETIIDGETGILFKPQDCCAIVRGVKRCLKKTREERGKMGIEARNYISLEYDRKYVIEKYRNVE